MSAMSESAGPNNGHKYKEMKEMKEIIEYLLRKTTREQKCSVISKVVHRLKAQLNEFLEPQAQALGSGSVYQA
jgi:hypothetical protein